MKTFNLPVTWLMSSVISVEASSLDEAIKTVENQDSLPADQYYVDDSFRVNTDAIEK